VRWRPRSGKTWDPSKQRSVIEFLLDAGSDIEHKEKAGATVSSSAALMWTRLTLASV
jgi:hypothetical protein